MQVIGIITTTNMEFFPTPSPSPIHASDSIHQIRKATAQLGRRRLKNAFEAIRAVGEGMHEGVAMSWALDDLRHISFFFQAVLRRSAYERDAQVDRAIDSLLLATVRRCEELRAHQIPLPYGMLGWQSPTEAEIKDHLDACRNLLNYILSHHDGTRDTILDQTERLLQRLCPRISCAGHGPCRAKTSTTKPTRPRQTRKHSRAQSPTSPKPQHRSVIQRRPPPRACKPSKTLPPPHPYLLPTPPTQTGDVRCPDTFSSPTQLIHPLPPTANSEPPSQTLGRDDGVEVRVVDGWVEEVTQAWDNPRLEMWGRDWR